MEGDRDQYSAVTLSARQALCQARDLLSLISPSQQPDRGKASASYLTGEEMRLRHTERFARDPTAGRE